MPRAARSASRWISGRVGTVKDTETLPGDMARLLFEIKKVIVGQDHLLERILVALLARGHLLVEGVPGLAKTLSVETVEEALAGDFKQIQFTPDLVPADLVGTRIYNQRAGDFQTSLGPVFTNLLLADEINRAPAKVQSALLEVMQERQVTIGRETHKVPDPFLVMATQNPIETEGVYALPEAQVDRFMMKVLVGYPGEMDEFVVVERVTGRHATVVPVMTSERLLELQREVDDVFVDPRLMEYVVRIVSATRQPADYGLKDLAKYVSYWASTRGATTSGPCAGTAPGGSARRTSASSSRTARSRRSSSSISRHRSTSAPRTAASVTCSSTSPASSPGCSRDTGTAWAPRCMARMSSASSRRAAAASRSCASSTSSSGGPASSVRRSPR